MDFCEDLRGIVGRVVTDSGALAAYSRDQSTFTPSAIPAAAVFPETTGEVVRVVQAAIRHQRPIVARGAGTGLAGGANAVEGAVVVSFERMNTILNLDPDEQTATVQPGVINADLKARAADAGLWYPPDPASSEWSTIGGNLATNAGGLCCMKYGVTRDAVLALEVVLGCGTVVRVGRQTVKGVAGYDLAGLFVGSEGTLGLITEATVRLRRESPPSTTLVASFPRLVDVGAAITSVIGVATPSLLEVIDRTTVNAIERWKRMSLDTEAAGLLLAQSDMPGEWGVTETNAIAKACEAAGADFVVTTADREEAEMLLTARRLAYPALERLGTTMLDDVAIPRSRISVMLNRIECIAKEWDVTIGTFGHAGDGNLHPTIVFDATDQAQTEAAKQAFSAVIDAALELGGTTTGEHGVGLLKRKYLARELGDGGMALHRRVKDALDPEGRLNPSKLLTEADEVNHGSK